MEKYVKDKAHNRYPAYCCDDIDKRVGALEEAVAAIVAGTVPDGSVTLAKLAADARSWVREINRGTLVCEWIGTQEEYDAHISENGGEPLANCRYSITDAPVPFAQITGSDYPLGSLVTVRAAESALGDAGLAVGDERALYLDPSKSFAEIAKTTGSSQLVGTWRSCGETAIIDEDGVLYHYAIYQRVT